MYYFICYLIVNFISIFTINFGIYLPATRTVFVVYEDIYITSII